MEHFIKEMIQERKVFAEKEKIKALKKARKVISLLILLICPFIAYAVLGVQPHYAQPHHWTLYTELHNF